VVRGDEDGVVIIPGKRVREIELRAMEITRHEAQVMRKLKHGRPLAEPMKLLDRLIELRKRG
jgi:regulator of RNase E activity RraA